MQKLIEELREVVPRSRSEELSARTPSDHRLDRLAQDVAIIRAYQEGTLPLKLEEAAAKGAREAIGELRPQIDKLSETLQTVSSRANLASWISGGVGALLVTLALSFGNYLFGVKDEIGAIKADVANVRGKIETVEATITARLSSLDARVEKLERIPDELKTQSQQLARIETLLSKP